MKNNIIIIILTFFSTICTFSDSFATENIYSYTFIPTSKEFKEQSANPENFYFVHNYDFKENSIDYNIDHFELTLNFSQYDGDEDWHAQVMVGYTPIGYDYGEPLNGLENSLFTELFTIDDYSTSQPYHFDSDDSWFAQVVNSGIFTLALLETTQFKDSISLQSAKLEIFGSPAPVPVPGAALLLGSGLLGVVALRKRRAA